MEYICTTEIKKYNPKEGYTAAFIRLPNGYDISLIGTPIDVYRTDDGLFISLKTDKLESLRQDSQKKECIPNDLKTLNPSSIEQCILEQIKKEHCKIDKIKKEERVDIRVWSKERDLGSRRAGVRRFNSCSTHLCFLLTYP